MLTTESYRVAWAIYVLASLGILVFVRAWFLRHLAVAPMAALSLMLAALLLTPVLLPDAEIEAFAPAIVVVGFAVLTGDIAQVMGALRPLLVTQALALTVGIGFYVYRRVTADED